MKGRSPGRTFSFEFRLQIALKIDLYLFMSISLYSVKYFSSRHCPALYCGTSGCRWSRRRVSTLSEKLSKMPFFLNFSSARRTSDSINWKRTRPRSGTRTLPFQSGPDMELVVMKVRSVILSGVSLLMMRACWQNSVNGWLETAHTSPKGLQEENWRQMVLMLLQFAHSSPRTLSWSPWFLIRFMIFEFLQSFSKHLRSSSSSSSFHSFAHTDCAQLHGFFTFRATSPLNRGSVFTVISLASLAMRLALLVRKFTLSTLISTCSCSTSQECVSAIGSSSVWALESSSGCQAWLKKQRYFLGGTMVVQRTCSSFCEMRRGSQRSKSKWMQTRSLPSAWLGSVRRNSCSCQPSQTQQTFLSGSLLREWFSRMTVTSNPLMRCCSIESSSVSCFSSTTKNPFEFTHPQLPRQWKPQMCLFGSSPSAITSLASLPKLLKEISTCCSVRLLRRQPAMARAHPSSPLSPSWLRLQSSTRSTLLPASSPKMRSPTFPERQLVPMQSCSSVDDFSTMSARASRQPAVSLFLLRFSLLRCLLQRTLRKRASAEATRSRLLARLISWRRNSDSMMISSSRLSTCVILFCERSSTSTSGLMARTSSAKPTSVMRFAPSRHRSTARAFFSPAASAMMYRSPRLQFVRFSVLASPFDFTRPRHSGSTLSASDFSRSETEGDSAKKAGFASPTATGELLKSFLRSVFSSLLYSLQCLRGASLPIQGAASSIFLDPSSLGPSSVLIFVQLSSSQISSQRRCVRGDGTLEMQLWIMIWWQFSFSLFYEKGGQVMRCSCGFMKERSCLTSNEKSEVSGAFRLVIGRAMGGNCVPLELAFINRRKRILEINLSDTATIAGAVQAHQAFVQFIQKEEQLDSPLMQHIIR